MNKLYLSLRSQNVLYKLLFIFILFFSQHFYSQIVSPFNIRYQANQKGGIVILSNTGLTCNSGNSNCSVYQAQMPPNGNHNQDGGITMGYIDIDGNSSTFMSSSDSLNLANCSEVLWAGLYWSARIDASNTNYSTRNTVKLKLNNGAYQNFTADQLLDVQSISGNPNFQMPSYFCFKNITSTVQSAGTKGRFTVANIVSQTGSNNLFGAWSIVVVYKNVFQTMRNLTVFDGMAYVSSAVSVDIPISGFVTPLAGPVSFELGIVAHEGDRGIAGDRLQFNGNGSFLDVPDALRSPSDFFNSTCTSNGALTPFRNPSYNNNLGFDAGVFFPNNSTFNYISNNVSTATIRVVTSQDAILPRVITSAIDIYEPDLRADVRIKDVNGGQVQPGDILEYTLVGKNIGSDLSINTYMVDTLDIRTTYVPGSLSISYGPNTGAKTDALNDDQAEFISSSKVIRARVGTGANGSAGGQMQASSTGADSTVIKFRVTVLNDCLAFQCDPTISNSAYIYGTGNISGNQYNNGGISDTYNSSGCPLTASNELTISVAGCPAFVVNANSVCVGQTLNLTTNSSILANYSWTGPNNFTSTSTSPSIPNLTTANSGTYTVTISIPSLGCSISASKVVVVNPLPVINLVNLTNVTCFNANNGSIQISASGSSPFTYLWSNNATTTTISSLSPNSYSVTVKDIKNCISTASYTITQPTVLTATASITSNYNGKNISCFGASDGSALVTYSGGTSPYTVSWSNGATTAAISGLAPGTYTATITDAKGCVKTSSVTLTQPTIVALSETHTNVLCFGQSNGAINLSVTGGTPSYIYSWTNGATIEDLTNIVGGTYTVTVKDLNNCTKTNTVTILQPSAAIVLSSSITNITCFGNSTGVIDLSVAGGTTPYSYSWSNSATTQDLSSIPAGTYSVTVTDNNLCTQTLSATITQPTSGLNSSVNSTNLTCNGNSSGAIDLIPSGGTLPYSYLWSNNITTQDLNNISAGTYNYTITDATGCTKTGSITITQPAIITLTETHVNVKCFGQSTGSINLNVAGGTPGYSYSWSNGVTTEDLSNIASGNYTVTVLDLNGCSKQNTISITQPSAALTLTNTSTNVVCFGNSTGTIDLVVTGGTSPYSYSWSNSATTQDLAAISAGTYSVTVTDNNLCIQTLSTTIIQPTSVLNATTNSTNLSCFGNASGSIDLIPTGGTLPFTYLWSNNATTEDLSNIAAGTYTYTITDGSGCAKTGSVNLTQPAVINLTETHINVKCFGQSTGTINLTVAGGTPGYTYSWTNGAITEDLSNLSAGTYTVTVLDLNGCSKTKTVTITQPSAALSLTNTSTNVNCFGNSTGAVDLTVSGGTSPYTYSWSNSATTQDLSLLSSGTYSVTVTDNNLCSQTLSATITQPLSILNSSTNSTNLTCNGNASGIIDLIPTGGTLPYTYLWSNNATTEDLSNIAAGTYSYTITDGSGCAKTGNVTLTQPAVITLTETHINVKCFGLSTGSVNLIVAGGTPGYTYSWTNGAITEDLSNLSPGTYTVTVLDLNGCSKTKTVTITQPTAVLSLTNTSTNVACFGNSTGAIDLSVSGGTSPYIYSWSNSSTTQDLTAISAGTYSVNVTDNNLCTQLLSSTITQPLSVLSSSTTSSNLTCNGNASGIIDLIPTGGTLPYTYLWSNNATTEDLSNVAAGTYSYTITDGSGCAKTGNVTLTQPAVITLTETHINVKCFGLSTGSVNLIVAGGTPGYTYSWTNGAISEDLSTLSAGTYTVTVLDLNGCSKTKTVTITQPSAALSLTNTSTNVNCFGNSTGAVDLTVSGGTSPYTYSWSNSATTQDLSLLSSGTYSVTVTDNNLCTQTISSTLTQPSAALSSIFVSNNITCFGSANGSINLTPAGGTIPYTYSWSNSATTEDLINLAPNSYSYTITDARGCTNSGNVTITQPTNIVVSETHINVKCFGQNTGSINISVSGGISSYTYLWSNGATTEDLSNIAAGTYTLTVKDLNNCTKTKTVIITQPNAALTLSNTTTNVFCFGNSTGGVDLTVSGGTAPYSYSWSNSATTQDLSLLSAGNYAVTVTDNNLCAQMLTLTVSQPSAPLSSTIQYTNIACYGNSTGSINLIPTGGNPPYTYSWSNFAVTEDLSNLTPGTYSVTIRDLRNCTTTNSVYLSQPQAPLISSFTKVDPICYGANMGSIDLSVQGGSTPYSYSWTNGAFTQDLNNIVAGNYNVVITDFGGCTSSQNITLTQPAPSGISFTKTNVLCFGNATGAINATIFGGSSPFTYSWSNGGTTEDLSNIPAGTYSIVVTDAVNCPITGIVTVTQPASPLLITESHNDALCIGALQGSINLTVNGGTGGYSYLWNNNATTEDLTLLASGTYSVNVTDANNCSSTKSITILDPSNTMLLSETHQNVSCFGFNNASIDLNVSGGTAGYSYLWNNNLSTQDLSNLVYGNYFVTVTDGNQCQSFISTQIIQPTTSLSVQGIKTDVKCFGETNGSIALSTSGGSTPYVYSWSNGATTEDLNGLATGSYSFIATDNNNCTAVYNTTIFEPLDLVIGQSISDVSCFGGNNGSLDMTPAGGIMPYSYSWNNGSTSQDLSNLIAGNYTLTLTDANQCVDSLTVIVGQPSAPITISQIVKNVSCRGGSDGEIRIVASGGNSFYTFLWNTGATTDELYNLLPGTYTVTIKDIKNCSATFSIVVTQPAAILSLTKTFTPVICHGDSTGTATVNAFGGTSPYSYLWGNGATSSTATQLSSGTYSVLVTDANFCTANISVNVTEPTALVVNADSIDVLCNAASTGTVTVIASGGVGNYSYLWNTGQTSSIVNNLPSGNYNVVVKDGNQCTITATTIVNQPDSALNVALTHLDNLCSGYSLGSIDATTTGGTSPYTYLWSHSETTEDIDSLGNGNYILTVTDAHQCVALNNSTITSPTQINANSQTVNISCFGGNNGSLNISVSGGILPYNYLWNNSETAQDIDTLQAGTYNVQITDSNNCQVAFNFVVSQPLQPLTLTSTQTNVDCYGNASGIINLTVVGGTTPYFYNWSNTSTTQDVSNLITGNYEVIVTDNNGCLDSLATSISQPTTPLTLSESHVDILCNGASTGSIDLTVTGGTTNYSYNWNTNFAITEDLTNVPSGTYKTIVNDANNCIDSIIVQLLQPASAIDIQFIVQDVACYGDSTATVNSNITGGTSPYTYVWNTGETTLFIDSLQIGIYTLSVVDDNNCSYTENVSVGQPTAPISSSISPIEPLCFGYSDGQLTANPVGGTSPYNYTWSNGDTSQNIDSLATGNYNVTLTDANGCTFSLPYTLNEPPQLAVSFNVDAMIGCSPMTVNFTNTSQTNYACSWQFGDGNVFTECDNVVNIYQTGGIYDVTLTASDSNGCTNSVTYDDIITVNQSPTAGIYADPTVLSQGGGISNILNTSEGAEFYIWNLGDSHTNGYYFEPGPHQYPASTQDTFMITLIAISNDDCVDTAYQIIVFNNDPVYWAPNTFIPDDDGTNDVWNVVFSDPGAVKKFNVEVYDRWGEKIFESNDLHNGWDGTYKGMKSQDGTYTWILTFEQYNYKVFQQIGHVNLLR